MWIAQNEMENPNFNLTWNGVEDACEAKTVSVLIFRSFNELRNFRDFY